MYALIRPFLFQLEPERAHTLALSALSYLPSWLLPQAPNKPVQAMGLTFANPVGIAAGLDKDGQYLSALAKLAPGFIEIGTVTPVGQAGNDKPRLFRVPQAQALINRMGFNNDGVEALVARLKTRAYPGVLGINIGKNKSTANEHAHQDYLAVMKAVYAYADYITINISSPNTPDLRAMQQESALTTLLAHLTTARRELCEQGLPYVPLLVKVSPDETDTALTSMVAVIEDAGIDGIIATNTTTDHSTVSQWQSSPMQGGLSGQPLFERSYSCLQVIKQALKKDTCLIAVGGINAVEKAQSYLDAGATLVQVYTGLIYEGPGLIKRLVQGLRLPSTC